MHLGEGGKHIETVSGPNMSWGSAAPHKDCGCFSWNMMIFPWPGLRGLNAARKDRAAQLRSTALPSPSCETRDAPLSGASSNDHPFSHFLPPWLVHLVNSPSEDTCAYSRWQWLGCAILTKREGPCLVSHMGSEWGEKACVDIGRRNTWLLEAQKSSRSQCNGPWGHYQLSGCNSKLRQHVGRISANIIRSFPQSMEQQKEKE